MYEEIKRRCEKGEHVVVEDKYNNYCVFYPYLDERGNWKRSGRCNSIKKAEVCVGGFYGYTKRFIEECSIEDNWQITKVYKPTYKRYEVGDIVTILPGIEEYLKGDGVREGSMKKMIGGRCEILGTVTGCYAINTPQKNECWHIPDQFVTYYLETEKEETIEDILSTLPDKHKEIIKRALK